MGKNSMKSGGAVNPSGRRRRDHIGGRALVPCCILFCGPQAKIFALMHNVQVVRKLPRTEDRRPSGTGPISDPLLLIGSYREHSTPPSRIPAAPVDPAKNGDADLHVAALEAQRFCWFGLQRTAPYSWPGRTNAPPK